MPVTAQHPITISNFARRERAGRLSPRATLTLLATIVVAFLAASSAPTPLYATYQAEWHYSPITTTVVFGIYALAVLAALLTLGKLSDHIGRRPVLLSALVVQLAGLVVFSEAEGVGDLMVARVLQGLATGAALGAIGAGMMDVDPVRGALLNAAVPALGTGLGALGAGFLVQYLPAPTHLVFGVLGVVFVLQAVGVVLMHETVTGKPGAMASLIPEVRLPRAVRGPLLVAAPVLFAVWSLAGFYAAIAPSLVRTLTGSTSVVLSGLGLFLLAGVAAGSVVLLHALDPRRLMVIGIVALLAGIAVTEVAIGAGSSMGFFAGTAVAGIGFGSGFQGAIRSVLPLAESHERAGVLSLLFVVSYLGLGAPAVVAGWLVVHGGLGLMALGQLYGAAVAVLAAASLAALTLAGRRGSKVAR